MPNICKYCNSNYSITKKEIKYLDKHEIPYPTICHRCKAIHYLSYYNIRFLFNRKCEFTGKDLITVYDPESPQTVIDRDYRYSDDFDIMKYNSEFDFNKGFFDQLRDFFYSVPIYHNTVLNSENCDYCNAIAGCKDCYIVTDATECEKLYYSHIGINSSSCFDCFIAIDSENCYESIHLENCYKVFYSYYVRSCRDSNFLFNCEGCTNCTFCFGLKNMEYCIYNKQYEKDAYEKMLKDFQLNKRSVLNLLKQKFNHHREKYEFNINTMIENSENSSGGFILNCKNCENCFGILESEDCYYCSGMHQKNGFDTFCAGGENNYCFALGYNAYNVRFSIIVTSSKDLEYCMYMDNCNNCFACFGLRNKEYCIMNKEYNKEQYFELKYKIIEYAKSTKEYGEMFPIKDSPIAVNKAWVSEFFSKLDINTLGGRIYKYKIVNNPNAVEPIDDAKDLDETLLNRVFQGKKSKPFRLIKQELDFYMKYKIPMPDEHFDYRLGELFKCRDYDKVDFSDN